MSTFGLFNLIYSVHYIFKNHWQHIQDITAEHDYIWRYIADDIGQIVLFYSSQIDMKLTKFHLLFQRHESSTWTLFDLTETNS